MGTPIMGVIALMGIMPEAEGTTLMSVHNNATTAPARAVAGKSTI